MVYGLVYGVATEPALSIRAVLTRSPFLRWCQSQPRCDILFCDITRNPEMSVHCSLPRPLLSQWCQQSKTDVMSAIMFMLEDSIMVLCPVN